MNIQNPKTTTIKFRKVYLSDLKAVISIYHKKIEAPIAMELTSDFGLPLSLAVDHNEVIGVAFASINEQGKVVLNAQVVPTFETAYVEDTLEAEAENILYSTFENIKKDHTPLKHSIQQLVGWLNKCAN
ncbi:hypothetical protein H9X96_04470 [Pedobacter sp. N36a]|uniref:hypothetical protein n=1 Tax=Pedobacter sp. N36a TaxID=2767996 RepID=UPI00165716B8|nr:hypothetical protein [Pedobacter sp. N36a]MBC8985025.1 hypothetical protein [Pedobacter sp. N36a]